MPSAGGIDLLPAQYDDGVLIAHPAKVMRFHGVSVMVQRSAIDGKTLVTVDGDHRDTRILMNDGTVHDLPAEPPARPTPLPKANIADSPHGIAAHLAKPTAAKTEHGQRISQIHLRDVGDGYWTRVRLVTVREHGWFLSTLIFDHHKTHPTGECVREIKGASFPVRSVDAAGQITARQFESAHAAAAAVLVAYPEAIAHLLERNTTP